MIGKESPLKGMPVKKYGTVTIRELPEWNTIDIRVAPATPAQAAVTKALEIDFPGKPGLSVSPKTASGQDIHILCLAPDWWLITGLPQAQDKLSPLENDHHFSAVDVSDQRTSIELEGPAAKEVLAHLWEQDLREKNFPVGNVSQGLMAKSPVIVWHSGPFRYLIMVRRSFAVHLWKALTDAAEEYS